MRAIARAASARVTVSALARASVEGPSRASSAPHFRTTVRGVGDASSVSATDRARATTMSAPLGVLAGAFGATVGVGGGALIVPVLASSTSIPQRVVSGTSLVAVVSTAVVSARTFGSENLVDARAAGILGASAMVSAPFGARLTARMNCDALRRMLAYFLMVSAPLVPAKALAFRSRKEDGVEREFDAMEAVPQLVAIGVTAGTASGLLGIGGGTLVTPLLAMATPLSQAAVIGTSLLAMIPPSVVALGTHYMMGNVEPRIAAALALGTALGSSVGSSLAVDARRGFLEGVFFFGMLFLSNRTFRALKK